MGWKPFPAFKGCRMCGGKDHNGSHHPSDAQQSAVLAVKDGKVVAPKGTSLEDAARMQPSAPIPGQKQRNTEGKVCWFYQQGRCSRQNCVYKHEGGPSAEGGKGGAKSGAKQQQQQRAKGTGEAPVHQAAQGLQLFGMDGTPIEQGMQKVVPDGGSGQSEEPVTGGSASTSTPVLLFDLEGNLVLLPPPSQLKM